MRIQHNIMAMNSYRNYTNNVSAMKTNLERLSSGYKINRAGDDAAGLAISEKMRAQVTALKQAQNNAKSGINLVQTAEGALQEVQDMLNRMVKLAEQSANGTYDDKVDRNQLQKEFEKLTEEIDRINQSANFNGMALFGGPDEAGGAGGGTENVAAPSVEVPTGAGNAAKLTNTTGFAFDAAATSAQKDALNKVLGEAGKEITVTVADVAGTAANIEATDTVTVAGLDGLTGYTAKFVAADNSEQDMPANGQLTFAANGTSGPAVGDVKINIYDADDNKVGTLTIGMPADGDAADGATKVTMKAGAAAPAAAAGADAAKSYSSKVTGDDGTNALTANDTIKIGGKTYTLKAGGTGTDEIDSTANNTFAKQIKAAVDLYNAETGEDFKAEYKDGVMTFTPKEGKTPTAAPAFTIGDAANKISAGTVEEVEDTDADKPEGATAVGSYNLQIGDTSDPWNRITVSRYSIGSASLKDISEGTNKTLSELKISDETSAGQALTSLKGMVNYISDIRGELGATQNRLNHTINNLSVMEENIQDAESTIRDTDVAEEMMAYTKNNILIQSAQAMLAQANQIPQGVLQLLG